MHGCSVTLFSSWHATVCGVCLIMRKRLISCLRTFRSRNRRRRQACPATARTLRWHLFARQFVGGRLSTMYQLLSSCSSGDTRVKQPSDHISALLEVVHVLHVYRRWFCIIFSKQLLAELLRPEQANIFVVMFQQRSGNFLFLLFPLLQVFLAFFIAVIILMIVICIAQ